MNERRQIPTKRRKTIMSIKYTCTEDRYRSYPAPDVVLFDTIGQFDKLLSFFGEPESEDERMTDAERDNYFLQIKNGKWLDFVVMIDEKIVARAIVWNYEDQISEIGAIHVKPEYRKQGLGTQLVSCCTGHVLMNGRVATGITTEENIPMRKTFEKIGFC
jgi:predicted GNAT family acetyltransferase